MSSSSSKLAGSSSVTNVCDEGRLSALSLPSSKVSCQQDLIRVDDDEVYLVPSLTLQVITTEGFDPHVCKHLCYHPFMIGRFMVQHSP